MEFVGTVVLAIIAVAAATVGWFQYRAHVDPHVVVYAAADPRRPQMILLVIHNTGRGVAYNVKFKLDRPIPRRAYSSAAATQGERRSFEAMKVGPLVTGIAALGPGDKRVVTWGNYNGLIEKLGPEAVRITTTFESRGGHPWNPAMHELESYLDVVSFDANDASATLEAQAVEQLKAIAANVDKIARAATLATEPNVVADEDQEKEERLEITKQALLHYIKDTAPQK